MLVWQDFMFACAGYPEDDAYAAEIDAEARDNVARLCSHPSVAVLQRQQRVHLEHVGVG